MMFLLWNHQSQGMERESKDIIFSSDAANISQDIRGSRRLICRGDAKNIDINVSGISNKIELLLQDADSNNVTIDLSHSIYPTLSVNIDKHSCSNNVTIYSWYNCQLNSENHGDCNNIVVHFPFHKLIVPAVVLGFMSWLVLKNK